MTNEQIIKYIDDGALYYIKLLSMKKNMEFIDNGYYSIIKPKNTQGISFIFDVRLNNLSSSIQKSKIEEIRSFDYPIWLGLLADDELYNMLYGKEKIHQQINYNDNDEIYMALLPGEKENINVSNYSIVIVNSKEQFNIWTNLINEIFFNDACIMDSQYYHLCEKELVTCYILYHDNHPVATVSIANNNDFTSLEFVGTIKEMRNKGLATAICNKAVNDAIENNAKIITLRATNISAAKVYKKLGFKIYNSYL